MVESIKDEPYQDYSAYEDEKDFDQERNYIYDRETTSKNMQILSEKKIFFR